ncbi:hypothetical protein RQP46_010401 [Phenoliferia psychrophenolica]
MSSPTPPKKSSAQSVVLINAWAQTIVLLLQAFAPRRLYGGPIARAVSGWTGLHSLILAYGAAVLLHMWMAALSTRKHAHAFVLPLPSLPSSLTPSLLTGPQL